MCILSQINKICILQLRIENGQYLNPEEKILICSPCYLNVTENKFHFVPYCPFIGTCAVVCLVIYKSRY